MSITSSGNEHCLSRPYLDSSLLILQPHSYFQQSFHLLPKKLSQLRPELGPSSSALSVLTGTDSPMFLADILLSSTWDCCQRLTPGFMHAKHVFHQSNTTPLVQTLHLCVSNRIRHPHLGKPWCMLMALTKPVVENITFCARCCMPCTKNQWHCVTLYPKILGGRNNFPHSIHSLL